MEGIVPNRTRSVSSWFCLGGSRLAQVVCVGSQTWQLCSALTGLGPPLAQLLIGTVSRIHHHPKLRSFWYPIIKIRCSVFLPGEGIPSFVKISPSKGIHIELYGFTCAHTVSFAGFQSLLEILLSPERWEKEGLRLGLLVIVISGWLYDRGVRSLFR